MNKKGFTLVELLAVIAILAIVMTIAIINIASSKDNALETLLETKKRDIESGAVIYGQENQNELGEDDCPETCDDCSYCKIIKVGKLIDGDFVDAKETITIGSDEKRVLYNDVTGESMRDVEVLIYKKNNRVNAKIIEN